MSKNDALDIVLQNIYDEADWNLLLKISACEGSVNLRELSHDGKVRAFNIEIRKNYGNTVDSVIKEIATETVSAIWGIWKNKQNDRPLTDTSHTAKYKPDYDEILKGTAQKIGLEVLPKDKLELHEVECIERDFLSSIIERLEDVIVKENDGDAFAWKRIEAAAVASALENSSFTEKETETIKRCFDTNLVNAIKKEQIKGFSFYILIKELFFSAEKYFSEGASTVVFKDPLAPVFDFVMKRFLSAWGINVGEMFFADWKKTIGTIIFISLLRQKQKYADRLGEKIK